MSQDIVPTRPWNYYVYKCLPSTELRGKRPEHAKGYCGRPIMRKSKDSLPMQGSPCPNCSRRTRINESNLSYPESKYPMADYQRREFTESEVWTREHYLTELRKWRRSQEENNSREEVEV